MKKKVSYLNVTPEHFVEVWQAAKNVEEVSKKLGMPRPIVSARASAYRKLGIALKQFQRGGIQTLNVEALNELIAKVSAEHGLPVPELQEKGEPLRAMSREAIRAVMEQLVSTLHEAK